MKAGVIGKRTIQGVTTILNLTVLIIIIILSAFAGYALWDSKQIYSAADKSVYAIYKPTAANEGKSFKELQALNAEVFSWLTVYGTNIDYPVTQGQDNMKYVNTNAEGLYSLSGAIFLDTENSKDFSDFNSILYGHHMAKKAMFGEIGEFSDREMFDTHKYGNLYFDGKDHGIEFFAFLHTDAYDNAVFSANVDEDRRQSYYDDLMAKTMYKRDIEITTRDNIVLLSTCSSDSTNGRDILIGRIVDEVFDDPFLNMEANGRKNQMTTGVPNGAVKDFYLLLWLLILVIAARAIAQIILVTHHKRNQFKREQKRGSNI